MFSICEEIAQSCPNQINIVGIEDLCIVRRNFFHVYNVYISISLFRGCCQLLHTLMDQTVAQDSRLINVNCSEFKPKSIMGYALARTFVTTMANSIARTLTRCN